MAFTLEAGSKALDKEVIDAMVKQIQLRTFKFKQAVSIVPTSGLSHVFIREDPLILTGGANAPIEGTPFGADFAKMRPKWEERTVRIVPFKAEDNIAWETLKGSVIDIQARTVIKLTEAVVKAIDDYIYGEVTEDATDESLGAGVGGFDQSLEVQSFSLAADNYWNGTSAAIVNDIGACRTLLSDANYDDSNALLFVSPRDHQSIMTYVHDKGAQYNSFGEDVAKNGRVGRLGGVTIVETPTVNASFALMLVPKICATYNEFESLKSTTINDPFKSITIRIVEEGSISLTDPLAVVVIRGTQGIHQLTQTDFP